MLALLAEELRVLVEEYVVKDLSKLEQDMESQAEPDMTPSAPVWVPMMPQEVRWSLEGLRTSKVSGQVRFRATSTATSRLCRWA